MRLRQKKQLSARQVGENSAIPGHEIFALEEGNDQRYVSLQSYLNYARYLEVTLKEICEAAADVDISREQLQRDRSQAVSPTRQPQHLAYEIVVMEHLQEAITAFGEEVTRDDMAAYTGRPIEYLRQFNAARAILEIQAHDRLARMALQREQREDDLVKKVQEAIAILNERGKMPIRVAISHIVGLSWKRLSRRYPRVEALLMQYPRIDRKSRKQEEDILLTRVFVVMRAYKNVGLPASREAISRSLRIPLRQLRSYSRVKALLEQGL